MVNSFGNLSFRGKILCTYLLLMVLTIAVFVVCYIQGLTSALDYNISFMRQNNEQKDMNLDAVMGNHSSLNVIHSIDSKLNMILHEATGSMSQAEKYERELYVQTTLKTLTIINPNVLRSTILTKTGDVYCSISQISEDYVADMEDTIKEIQWENQTQKRNTQVYPHSIGNREYTVETVIHQLSDIGNRSTFAYLLVDLDFGAITDNFNRVSKQTGEVSAFAIISDEDVIYHSQNTDVNAEADIDEEQRAQIFEEMAQISKSSDRSGTVRIRGADYIAAVKRNESTGWYLVQYIPRKTLVNSSMESMMTVMYWVILILAAAGALSLILSKQVSRPLRRLSETMAQARQGEVKLYEEKVTRKDEIGQLIDIYNAMGGRINDSITKLYIAQLNQKQTELKMLQFQINPHFLYNALNTVSAIARLEDIEEIPAITESLCDMFRYNTKGSDFVTLEEELVLLKNYLQIQSIRFPGQFVIEYDILPQLRECGMIKFVLQPIVENSIKHAFTQKRETDFLRISAKRERDDDLLLEVYDDGCGIPPKQVRQINETMQQTKANILLNETAGGIGLINVNARLKNFYGERYGITVESELGSYTKICLRLKIKD